MRTRKTTGRVKGILFVVCLFSCLPVVAWSQTGDWTVYNTANSGLPYDGVTALAFDAQGVVWVGTGRWYAFDGGGLARFDGQSWTVYNTANSPLPGNDHISLSIDAEGNIWSGTETGLSKFDGQNWTVYRTSNSGLPNNQAGAPVFDMEGNAWIGTGAGLAKFDGQSWTVYNQTNSGIPAGLVTGVTLDARGVLWIGTFGNGLVKFDGKDWTRYHTGNSGLTYNSISFMAAAPDGSLWMGTYGGGLIHFAKGAWTTFVTSNSPLPSNMVWNVTVDAGGNVWAATEGGLAAFDGMDWTLFDSTNSGLPDNNVYCVAFDAQGNAWVGTANGGLAVFRPRSVVDFNGDGIVDIHDLLRLIESWGTDDLAVDIAPEPFGDGLVDAADLDVLMGYWKQEIQDTTLRAHWKLDEGEGAVASDSAGTNDGIVIGASWRPEGGAVGGAIEFDGIDDRVAMSSPVNPVSSAFSVLAWIKTDVAGRAILSQFQGQDWLLTDSTGGLMTNLKGSGRHAASLSSQTLVTDGRWHRVGLTWEDPRRTLLVDDVIVAEDKPGPPPIASGALCIGAGSTLDPATFWSGLIDDVRIYNRTVKP
ncbi:MAG TPA: two-component regulator propeller domain-containing protein [Sedimentisphaerales bacterium]|jgi:sugar lactone lactonase YvrE|nr:two-component regulator propeller domain-containing protein [Sedimentisphaerales bacterium]HNU29041.1 two-component regulator propeller domain-containing protein [Sedimentisphaerales bacterium]